MDVKSFSSRWLYRNPNQLTFTCLPLQIELSLFSTSRYTKFYSLYIIIFAPQHRNSEGLLILQLYMDSKSPTLTERCGNKNPICFTVPPIAFRSVFHGNKCYTSIFRKLYKFGREPVLSFSCSSFAFEFPVEHFLLIRYIFIAMGTAASSIELIQYTAPREMTHFCG